MVAQQPQHLALAPPRRNRPVRRLEGADRLRPLARLARRAAVGLFGRCRCGGGGGCFFALARVARAYAAARADGPWGCVGRGGCGGWRRGLRDGGFGAAGVGRRARVGGRYRGRRGRSAGRRRGRRGFGGGRHGVGGRLLRGPVVDVPVVLVEEAVELGHLVAGHGGQVRVREGGQKQVGLEGPALAALVCGVC